MNDGGGIILLFFIAYIILGIICGVLSIPIGIARERKEKKKAKAFAAADLS
jgi:hypothetical protein